VPKGAAKRNGDLSKGIKITTNDIKLSLVTQSISNKEKGEKFEGASRLEEVFLETIAYLNMVTT
jgi:hypothetical protein